MELALDIWKNLSKEQQNEIVLKMFLPNSTVHNDMPVVTNGKYVEIYLEYSKKRHSDKYYKSNQVTLKHFINYFGEQTLIAHIGRKESEDFIDYLRERAPKGYVVYLKNLKATFNKAVDWNYISSNSFLGIKPVKRQKPERKFIKENEVSLILEHINNEVIRDMVIVSYNTGLRISEAVLLPWSSVKLDERILHIGTEDFITKSRKVRYVPIPECVFTILSKYVNKITSIQRKHVFTKTNGHLYTTDYVSKSFTKACRKAELDRAYSYHGLRHGYASTLAQKGISIQVIKELLGHSNISTTLIYAKLELQTLRDAVNVLNEV